jgi:hypothetical protein
MLTKEQLVEIERSYEPLSEGGKRLYAALGRTDDLQQAGVPWFLIGFLDSRAKRGEAVSANDLLEKMGSFLEGARE